MNTIDWKNATPEQKLLWDYASGLIAYNTIEPLVYSGVILGSEFLTYNADKLYICLEGVFSYTLNGPIGGTPGIVFMDEANAAINATYEFSAYWDATAANYRMQLNPARVKNTYFSRITNATYSQIKFIGYRLTIV